MKIANPLNDTGNGLELSRVRGIIHLRIIAQDGQPMSQWGEVMVTDLEESMVKLADDGWGEDPPDPIAGPWLVERTRTRELLSSQGWVRAIDEAMLFDTPDEAELNREEAAGRQGETEPLRVIPTTKEPYCPRCLMGAGQPSCGKVVHIALDEIANLQIALTNVHHSTKVTRAIQDRINEITDEIRDEMEAE